MSFKVLVIPEDPTHNGYILKPLVEAIMADAGRPAAQVIVLTNPKLTGYEHAVQAIRAELPQRYNFYDLWVFVPDADRASQEATDALEADLGEQGIPLLCCRAEPEVEIFACAAYHTEVVGTWNDARTHARMKEDIFAPMLAKHGEPRRAGEGRDLMIAESIRNLQLLFQLCPELGRLRDRIRPLVQGPDRA